MRQIEPVSLSMDQVTAVKRAATHEAPYADRVSLGFAIALSGIGKLRGEDYDILHEISVLEGFSSNSSTKDAAQFKKPPLHPFWHKHFSTARHTIRNIGERWGLENSGNRDLSTAIQTVAQECGNQAHLWQKRLAHRVVLGGLEDRSAARRLTGDWIIFAKHEGRNFYLGLGTHEEANDVIYQRLRGGSEWEFPFLFPCAGADNP